MLEIKTFFDEQTSTLTHLAYDAGTKDAVVFDPVLDLDTTGWCTYTESLKKLDDFVGQHALKLHYVLDTHVHADHLSGMQYLKEKYQVPLVINAAITRVQNTFKGVFNLSENFDTRGADFDQLVSDGDQLSAGSILIEVLHTPGHTPACTSYKIENNVFTGDALFMPDIGTGRCDFPEGSARELYQSVTNKLYCLPDDTKVFPAHDYPGNASAGRELKTFTTIGESKRLNIDLPASRSEEDYVAFMLERDAKLPLPELIYPSVQINLTAGQLPRAESNGQHYLKIPVTHKVVS